MNSALALQAHRTLNRLAFSFMHVYAWIFVFLYFGSIFGIEAGFVRTILLFALSQTILVLTIPFALQHLRHGMKRGMIYATVLAAAAFVVLGAVLIGYFARDFSLAMVLFAIFLGLYRGVYRIPYQIESRYNATTLPRDERILAETLVALMPAFAGYLLVTYSGIFVWLLFGVATLLILSLAPLFRVDDVYEQFTWGYAETFGSLLLRKHRKLVLANFFAGAEGVVLVLVWPIAILMLVNFSLLVFGAVLSLGLLLTLLARIAMRRSGLYAYIEKSPVVEAVVAFSAWVLRLSVIAPFSIVFVDAYGRAKDDRHHRFALLHEHTVDGGLYLDEYTALKEESRALGKIAALLAGAILASFFALPAVFVGLFVLAGISAVLAIYYTRRQQTFL